MLRHAFRRLLWVLPSVVGVSIITFFVLSHVPTSAAPSALEPGDGGTASAGREDYLHLPLFVNTRPQDVRTRVERALIDIVRSPPASEEAEAGRLELTRLGGAGLPFVLPRLDALPPDGRVRLALALAPLGPRMGLPDRGELDDPQRVVLFWTRFWETRGVEFRAATARSAVHRYARYGSEARAEELRVLDTFVLEGILAELAPPTNRSEVATARRLIELAAHCTGRNDRIAADATPDEAAACADRWQRWWTLVRADYVPLVGVSRFAAVVLETRFGKWAREAVFMGFGRDQLGRPLLDELVARARVSLAILLLALALAYGAAIPLGALSAVWRGGPVDRIVGIVVLAPYALSPAVLGVLAVGLGWLSPVAVSASPGALVGAAVLLALALLADPTRHQRAALLPVLTREQVRAAVARGASPWRVVAVHGLRASLFPLATRASLELPAALTAVFVLERAFGLPGLGEATITAVGRGDVRWLMALTVFSAAWAVVALVLADVATATLDPRLRSTLLRPRRRRG